MISDIPPDYWKHLFDKDRPSAYLALDLFKQIEEQDQVCAFWMVSAMDKLRRDALAQEAPETAAAFRVLLAILEEACPRASAEYRNYIADT